LKFGDIVFVEGGRPENLEKNPQRKARTNNKHNPHIAPRRNQTQATLEEGKSALSAVPALLPVLPVNFKSQF